MSDELIDLTPYVKSFDLIFSTGIKPNAPETDEDKTFTWNFPTVEQKIEMQVEPEFVAAALGAEKNALMKMEQTGKYWFDVKYHADVYIHDVVLMPDGSITATYNGFNIQDRTDRGWLARFLRWLLRR